MSPTGNFAQTEPLARGYGYFGSSRANFTFYHGGGDFKGTKVLMPTDAPLIGVAESFVNKTSIGYTLTFDLGDGMQLAVLHVHPSQELLQFWARTQNESPPQRMVQMGHELGDVDTNAYGGRNDHTHLQITLNGGFFNGAPVKGFAVDPTRLFDNASQRPSDWKDKLLKDLGLR